LGFSAPGHPTIGGMARFFARGRNAQPVIIKQLNQYGVKWGARGDISISGF
jgi:hypothetical protein